ncbi:MAG: NADPH:quinone reductase [Tepidisphaeraceae bacterium]
MKAIQVKAFGGPEVLQLVELPDTTPGDGHVLVRLHAAGVNPVDTYIRAGTYATKPQLPYIPGGEGAGVIEALGPNVVGLTVGARVWVSGTSAGRMQGTYAERAVCPAAQVHPLPDGVSFEQGAAINIAYVTAYRALMDRADLRAGEIVLIHGATGGVGLAAVQIASHHGAIVLGTGGTEAGRQLAQAHGAARLFDHKASGYLQEITDATQGNGVDVVIEMLANVNLDKDLGLLAPGGRVVVIGNRGRVEIDPRQMMGKESSVTGVTYWGGGEKKVFDALAAINAHLRDGAYRPHVGERFALAEAARAQDAVMGHSGAQGKIVLTM